MVRLSSVPLIAQPVSTSPMAFVSRPAQPVNLYLFQAARFHVFLPARASTTSLTPPLGCLSVFRPVLACLEWILYPPRC